MVVYMIINLVNLKIYVGQTTKKLKYRIGIHKCKTNSILGEDIKKYGWENFRVYVIEECNSQEELWERERYWIKMLNSQVPFGYNIFPGCWKDSSDMLKVPNTSDIKVYDEKNIEVNTILHVIKILSSKWKVPIILCLAENGNIRFGEIKRHIPSINSIMFEKSLKELESDGLINRKVLKSAPPQIVEYSLTPLALELLPALNELYSWGSKHLNG